MSSNQERKTRRKIRKRQSKINFKLKRSLTKDIAFAPCCYCKLAFLVEDLTIEHKVPRCLGGTNDVENIDLACPKCNHERGRQAWFLKRKESRFNYGR